MNQRYFRSVLVCGLALDGLGLPCSQAMALTLNFESLADAETVTGQFAAQGITFQNTDALRATVSLNEAEFPPLSGAMVVSDSGGAMSITFNTPMASVAGYFTYAVPLSFSAFDRLGAPLGSVASLFDTNLLLSGSPGSSPNELLQLAFVQGIDRLTITGGAAGASFTLDDLTLQPVPEPSMAALLCIGLAFGVVGKAGLRRWRAAPS